MREFENSFGDYRDLIPNPGAVDQFLQHAKKIREATWFNTGDTQGRTQPQEGTRVADASGSTAQQIDFDGSGYNPNVPRSLIRTESGGNFQAQNNVDGFGGKGHYGQLQFSQGRLEEAKNAGVIPKDMTPEQFLQDPNAQVRVGNWHFADIDNRIFDNGLDYFIGKTVGGVPVTMDGMRAMAHLGGFRGMYKFLHSDGKYNPADAFGTSLKKYGTVHQ